MLLQPSDLMRVDVINSSKTRKRYGTELFELIYFNIECDYQKNANGSYLLHNSKKTFNRIQCETFYVQNSCFSFFIVV